ncbi:MAG TPA: acyl-CoA thioesterase [Jiangellaceae bacterium]
MEPFQVRLAVRGYELDPRGHVNQAVYLQYTEHARWEHLSAAGISHDKLHESGVGPVALEQTVRYFAELRGGDQIDVTSEFRFGTGKTFDFEHQLRRPDGTRVGEVIGVAGLLDLTARKLIPSPGERFRLLATEPGILGL